MISLTEANKIVDTTLQQYNRIAPDFDSKRSTSQDLTGLGKFVKAGELILDAGCGNGRLIDVLRDQSVHLLACDGAKNFIAAARQRYHVDVDLGWLGLAEADVRDLPFDREQFDKIFCLAVLHHIPSAALQQQVLHGLRKIIKPGGLLIGTVWNLAADKFWQRYKLDEQEITRGRNFADNDFLIPWKATPGTVIQRFCHSFTLVELQELFQQTSWQVQKLQFVDRDWQQSDAQTGLNIFWVVQAI